MGEEGLKVLRTAADKNDLIVISEIMNQTQIPMFLDYVDILQVGARNMQNFDLLKELAKVQRAGPAETRAIGNDRGMASLGRIYYGWRKSRRDAVRAWNSHL